MARKNSFYTVTHSRNVANVIRGGEVGEAIPPPPPCRDSIITAHSAAQKQLPASKIYDWLAQTSSTSSFLLSLSRICGGRTEERGVEWPLNRLTACYAVAARSSPNATFIISRCGRRATCAEADHWNVIQEQTPRGVSTLEALVFFFFFLCALRRRRRRENYC